jgi:hypothetical protein
VTPWRPAGAGFFANQSELGPETDANSDWFGTYVSEGDWRFSLPR